MAQTKVLTIQVNGVETAINSIDDLENGVKQLEEQLGQAQIGSKEFKQLQNEVKKAKSQLKDFELQVEGLDKEQRATALVDSFNGLTGAVGAVSSAFIAFGAESGAIEEAEKKLLGVIGVVSGLRDVSNGLVATQKLLGNTSVKLGDSLKTAFSSGVKGANLLKGALVATGIGALVVAVGLLVQYWDDIAEFIGLAGSEQEKAVASAEANVTAQQQALDAISGQENILKLQGKSERDILNLKIAQTDEVIKALEGQLIAQEELKNQQIQTAERNKNILNGILTFLTAPLQLLARSVDATVNVFSKITGFTSDLTGTLGNITESIAELVFNPEKVEEEGDATIAETQKQLDALKNQRAGFQLQVQNIDDKAATDAQAQRDKDAADAEATEKDKNDKLLKAQQDLANARRDLAVKRLNDERAIAQQELDNAKQALAEQREAELAEENLTEEAKFAIREKYRLLEEGAQIDYNNRIAELDAEAAETKKAQDEEDLQRALDIEQAKFQLASQSISAVNNLLDAFTTEDDARNKKIFQAQKAFSISQAIIDTYGAVSGIFKNAAANPSTILFPAQPYIQAGIALATGLANVKKIASTQYQSTNAGGGGGVKTPPSTGGGGNPQALASATASFGQTGVPNTQTQAQGGINQQQIQNPQPLRAYVIAGDVVDGVSANEKLNQRRTL